MKKAKDLKWHLGGSKAERTKRQLALERGYRWSGPWRDTHMASAGAEHFVVAQLMFRDIDAFKCERGRAGVDIVAANTQVRSSVGIQVKSRYDRASDGFPIKTAKADFVVFVRRNLDARSSSAEVCQPDCYLFPASIVKRAIEVGPRGTWHKCHLRRIRNVENYREARDLIAKSLRKSNVARKARSART